MQYEVEVQGRLRQVHVQRVDGRFVVAVDGTEWAVDAAHVDAYTLSLLIAPPSSAGPTFRSGEASPAGAPELKLGPTASGAVSVGPTFRSGETSTPGSPELKLGPTGSVSYEVTIAPDPASGGLIVRVGETPLPVSINGRRRSGRQEETVHTGTGPQRIVAPMPGKIVRVLVKRGEAVRARQPVVIIEAMKMENDVRAASDGTLAEIHVRDGQSVEAGALLAVIHR